jgi:hypothetical protein
MARLTSFVHRLSTSAKWTLGTLIVAIVAARLAAPYFVLKYVNKTLDELEGYSGHVADIDLALWRGAYRIEGVEIVKDDGKLPVPLFSAPLIDLSVQWRALLDGSIVAEIGLHKPKINLVAEPPAPAESARKVETTKVAGNWQEQVKELVPFDINHVSITDGEVHFRNFHTKPQVDLYIQRLNGRLKNLTNSEDLNKDMVATAEFSGLAMGSGKLALNASIDPYSEKPAFDLDAKIENLQLTQLNEFLRGYASLDAEAGTISVYTELASENGRFNGYVKPHLEDVKILDWKKEEENFFGKMWEALAEGAKELLENEETDRVATRIPLQGKVENPEADIWTTVVYVLRNAFIQALQRGLEGSVGKQ